jgi:hypothetical protein
MSTLEFKATVNIDSKPVKRVIAKIDLIKFIEKFKPSKYKKLNNGIEIRGVADVQSMVAKARELISELKLNLIVVDTAEMAAYRSFEVREVIA